MDTVVSFSSLNIAFQSPAFSLFATCTQFLTVLHKILRKQTIFCSDVNLIFWKQITKIPDSINKTLVKV